MPLPGFESLRRRLYVFSFLDEVGPLYAVYTLWFNDNGASTSEISALFLFWAVVAIVLEVPSGALADRVDRRMVVALALGLRAIGVVVWLVWLDLPGLFVGAFLWAMHDALASGAWQALVHDELEAVDAAHRYGNVMARLGQLSHLGIAVGAGLACVALRWGSGLAALGWITVALNLAASGLVATLPDCRGSAPAVPGEGEGWWLTLRSGIAEATRTPVIGRLVLLVGLLEGLFIIDEYVPLLTRARGGSDDAAPVIVVVVWIGLLLGGEVSARWERPNPRWLGSSLVASMIVTGLAFVDESVWTLGLVAVGYAALQVASVNADARLQERTAGATRATVTSVAAFGGSSVSMVMFVVIAAVADGDDPTPGILVAVAGLAVAGWLVALWLPSHRPFGPILEGDLE